VRRLLLLTSLSLVLALMLAPMAFAQDSTATATPTATITPTATPTVAAKAQYGGGKKVVVLPKTGGASGIALLAGALLVSGGVMSFALFRRS